VHTVEEALVATDAVLQGDSLRLRKR